MISDAVLEVLKGLVPEGDIHTDEPMSAHTSFKVGGPADCLIDVSSIAQLKKICSYLDLVEEPFFILGRGTNLLVGDHGFRGVILHFGKAMSGIRLEGTKIIAQCGAALSDVAKAAYENDLTGLEFASGIPGSVGGGVVMNAGAYGGEMKQVVSMVRVMNRDGEEMELDNATMEFGYRTSVIRKRPFLVTEAEFQLAYGDREQIRATMDDYMERRRDKQPLEYPSAGSTFKRPEGHYAGELIMNSGLRGFQIGGARVSDKHCGFVINTGDASAEDILNVISEVQRRVKEQFDVDLEPEVVMLGEF